MQNLQEKLVLISYFQQFMCYLLLIFTTKGIVCLVVHGVVGFMTLGEGFIKELAEALVDGDEFIGIAEGCLDVV
jgi:hypothetical protein